MRRGRNPQIISGRVNGDGTIAAGDGFTVQRTAAGTYIISVPAGFRLVSATASSSQAACWANANTFTATTFVVVTYTSAVALSDLPFTFTAVGA